jgi:hypothetical protein
MRISVSLVVIVLLTSCANLSFNDVYRSPTFKYQDTQIAALDWASLDGVSTIEITNSNRYALPVSQVAVEIWLEGSPWLTLDSTAIDTLPASSSVSVDFNWGFIYSDILLQAKGAYDRGEADFSLHVRPTLNVPVLGPQTLAWQADFALPIPKLPTVSLSSWSLENISFTSVTLNLGLNLLNPNKFSLDGNDLGLTVSNDGRDLTQIGVPDLTVPADSTSEIGTQVTMSLKDAGLTVFDGLRQRQWPDSLDIDWAGDLSSKELGVDLPSLNNMNINGLN